MRGAGLVCMYYAIRSQLRPLGLGPRLRSAVWCNRTSAPPVRINQIGCASV